MAKTFEPNRLEAFSDGVLAVIITIMVLELKVPRESGIAAFHAVLPTLLVYALSFTFIAIYWVNHHELIGRLKTCNNRILWANLLWMFAVFLTPFFTAWVLEHKLDTASVQIYAACMLAAGATFLLLRYTVDCQLEREGRSTQVALATRVKHWLSVATYTAAVLLAGRMPRLALGLTALVAILWIVPTLSLPAVGDTEDPLEQEGLVPRANKAVSALHSTAK